MTQKSAPGVSSIFLCIFGLASFVYAQDSLSTEADAPPSTRTQVVLLGTGTPNADPFRSGPCVAVVVNDKPYLVDFGPGVVRRASAAYLSGVPGLEVSKLSRAFVTHLHSDHTAGYADLILTPWVLERTEPLQVFGPEGTREMTEHILAAYQQDIYIRLFGTEPINNTGYKVIAKDVKPGVIYKDDLVTVEAFLVKHGSWPQAFGYRFVTPDRTVVISGDTAPTETIVEMSRGCDVLVHEVYTKAGFGTRNSKWQNYHSNFHTSTVELAQIAKKAKPKLLVLYHQLSWGVTHEQLVEEVKAHYDGKVVSGRDLDVY